MQNLAALNVQCDLVYRIEADERLIDLGPRNKVFGITSPGINKFSVTKTTNYIAATLREIGDHRYDVVHVQNFRGCSVLSRLGRKISSGWLLDIRTSNVTSRGWKANLADYITKLESRAFTEICIHSEELGRAMLGNLPYVVVPPGVDIARFRQGEREVTRQQLNLTPDDVVIIYTGALNVDRNPFQILETFAKVAAMHVKSKLLVVGTSNLLSQLKSWTEEHNLAQRIIFTGRVPYHHVQNYVAAADIGFAYVPVTSNYEFNPPLKTAEFLAAGLPTVATNTAGNQMYIQHEYNGLLAEDDTVALAQAIQRLMNNSDLKQYLCSNAYQSITAYDWREIIRTRLLPLYQHHASI